MKNQCESIKWARQHCNAEMTTLFFCISSIQHDFTLENLNKHFISIFFIVKLSSNYITAILGRSPFTIYKHFENKNCIHGKLMSALLQHFRIRSFSTVLRKNRLRHLEWLCTKCHQVLQLRLRTITQSVIFWLSFDFGTVNAA